MVPEHIPFRDAVEWLVRERRFSVIGLFSFFLWTAGDYVTLDDIPTVLKYMTKEEVFHLDRDIYGGPFDHEKGGAIKTITGAFLNLDSSAIREALEEYWVAFMNYTNFGCRFSIPHLTDWEAKFSLIEANRRRFAEGFLSKYRCTLSESMYREMECFLLDPEVDGPWLLGLIPQAAGILAHNLPQLVRRLFGWGNFRRQHPGLLLNAWKTSLYLQKELPADPGEDGPLAALDRREEVYTREQAETDAQQEAEIAEKRHRRNTEWNIRLSNMEAGLMQSQLEGGFVWPEAYRYLLFTQCGQSGGIVSHKYAVPPASPKEWISEAARRFLLEWPLESATRDNGLDAQLALTWLGADALTDAAISERLEAVWLPWLIDGGYDGHPDWMPKGMDWLNRFPATELTVLAQIAHSRYFRKDGMTFLKQWEGRWTEKHTAVLINLLMENPIQESGAGQAWFFLAERDFPLARRVVETWLDQLIPHITDELPEAADQPGIHLKPTEGLREMSRSVGTALEIVWGIAFTSCRGLLWEQLQDTALSEEKFVKRAINAVHHSWSRWQFYSREKELADWVRSKHWVSDSALVAFAEIIWKLFPRAEREPADHMGFRAINWQDEIVAMRYAVVNEAQRRGLMVSPPAMDEAQVPRLSHEAAQHRLALRWHPFKPGDFFHYAHQPEARLARNNAQLMECVLEALDRWEIEVASPAGQGQLLNFQTGKPREEPVISKNIKDWLKQHLKILGSAESQPFITTDERLDVLLEWPIPAWNQVLSLIIEVKKDTYRSTGKTLLTEMEQQLLRTYLEPQHRLHPSVTHGLYLVIWISGKRTDQKITAKIATLREKLTRQAGQLSIPPLTLKSRVIDARGA